ncbi:MAG: Rieske 2Fe-2S domain-containing protein [Mycobacteriales bacterium]
MTVIDRLGDALEHATSLDRLSGPLASFWSAALRPPALRDAVSGTALGHPLHPAAVLVPAGAFLSSTVLDAADEPSAARRLAGIGVLTAAPAAVAGWSDWLDTEGAERRVGLVHAAANALGITAYGVSWLQRRRGHDGRAAGVVGLSLIGLGGWLGGHLAFALGVGVDTTAFRTGPAEWTPVAGSEDITDALSEVDAGDVTLVLTRLDGQVVAMENRCTHRGGALAEGSRVDGCVECPWHGSRFDLVTGAVRRGPATRPQPTYEVREREGRVEVRRQEARSLRANPV